MADLGLLKERAKFKRLLKEYEAVQVFLNLATRDSRAAATKARTEVEKRKISEVRAKIRELEAEIQRLRRKFGVTAQSSFLLKILEQVDSRPDSDYLMPKFMIDTLCTRYDGVVRDFSELQPHVLVGLHSGLGRNYLEIELYLLEAVLFEDMCALFNMAKESEQAVEPHKQGQSKVARKGRAALYHATITATFNFLEAYINGIAFDHYIVKKDSLDNQTKKLLTEWDTTNNRPHYVSLRDKIVKYTRIALGVAHPPIQENNCPELEYLAMKVRPLRDAIVHPAPGPDIDALEPGSEKEFFNLDFSEVERIVDSAIALVRKIEKTIGRSERRLFWLFDRASNGLFADEVFK